MKNHYTIDINLCKKMGIYPSDMMILENVDFLTGDTNWCYASKKNLAAHHGITERGFFKIRLRLVDKNYLKSNSKGHLKVTKRYKDFMSVSGYEQSSDYEQSSYEQSSDEGMNKVPTYPIKEDNLSVDNIVTHLKNKILSLKPNFKTYSKKAWSREIDLAMRVDKRSEAELLGCIDWIYTADGDFWKANILSGKKLRDKFDVMEAQMMSNARTKDNGFDDLLKAYNANI